MMGSAIEGTCQSDTRGIERARKGSAANRETIAQTIGRTRTERGTPVWLRLSTRHFVLGTSRSQPYR
jgi:hypothetical protein